MSTTQTTTNDSENLYTLQTGLLTRSQKLLILWRQMKGVRALYLLGILALALEAFFTFASPVVIKITIDSVLGTEAVSVPPPVDGAAYALLGPNLEGGGLINVTGAIAKSASDNAPGGEWALRYWLRDNLWMAAVAFLCFALLQALFGFLAGILSAYASEQTAKRMRDNLFAHMQNMPYEALLRAHSGDWLQRCTSDVDTARRFLAIQFVSIARTIFLIGTAFPIMMFMSPALTAWGSIVIPVIVVFSVVFFHLVEKAFLVQDQCEGRLSGIIQENVTGVRVVRAFARQYTELTRFDKVSQEFRELTYKLIMYLAFYWGFSSFLAISQVGVVLVSGLTMVQTGALTLGTLVVFLAYEGQLLFPLRELGRTLADSGKALVAVGRIGEILALREEPELDEGSKPELRGDIEFDNVSFTYPDGTEVLKNLNFTVKQGEVLAILGPTGAGKSTLVHLLARLYEPSSGTIRIDGVDIRTIAKRHLRAYVALVLQEGFLFGKTVRENIRLAHRDAHEGEILEASRTAALHQVVESFAKGYQTMVGERGVTLSGGQRQRLSLARALIRKAPVLVLDDSLSAVDTETDAAIRKALGGTHKATTLIIAHRITTLASASRILVLEQGKLSDIGTHAELIARPGLYQRLWNLQNSIAGEEPGGDKKGAA